MAQVIEVYKLESHQPDKLGGISWLVCKKCGLVYLRNEFAAWCIKMGCNNADRPQYKHQQSKAR